MALVELDSWGIENDSCERLEHEIRVMLQQRDQFSDLKPIYTQLTANLRESLKKLRKDVMHLKSQNEAATLWETQTPEELDRRRRIFEMLYSNWKELEDQFIRTSRDDTRAHFDNAAASSSRNVWQKPGDTTNQPVAAPPVDVASLKQRQIDMLEDQNRGLEALSQTISRQRELASQLGNEVDDQNDILDNLANTMERVESGVQRETGNLGQVNRRDSTWGYWLVIIALFIAIIIVAFL